MAEPWGPHDEYELRDDLTRRRVLKGLLAAAGLAAAGTGVSGWAAQTAARADSLILRRPGSRPFPNRPEGIDTIPQLDHIVIYMQENQSFDHYFGTHPRGDGFRLGPDGLPADTNPDRQGNPVRPTTWHPPATPSAATTAGAGPTASGTTARWTAS
ncbi:MAG: alkaline phosphatase family protein [Acidimicrobiales bacterium]